MRVPITAYAACNGLGRTTAAVLAGLHEGRRGLSPCPLDVPFETVSGVIPGELPAPPAEFAAWDTRTLRIALLALSDIADTIAAVIDRWGPRRVGMVLGTSTGGIVATEAAFLHWKAKGTLAEDYQFHTQHPFHAFAEVVQTLARIEGPSWVVSTACSSSAKVFSSARRLLRAGYSDAVLVGGIDSLCLTTVRGFHSLGVLAREGCRPFCADRVGMNVGEGAAFLMLEREAKAEAKAKAYLLGIGETNDAFHMSAPDPEGRGASAAMRQALDDAGLNPTDIDHVNAHGTGTRHNDLAEGKAIVATLGHEVPVVSTKSYTGHLLGASGATEAIVALMALEHQRIPANLGLDPVDPAVALNLPDRPYSASVRHVLSNSLAFGGNNASLIFGAAP